MNLIHPTCDAELPSEHGTLRAVRLAQQAGAARLAANLYEIERGARVSPLHFHHANEELLFVLSGTPTLRQGHGEERTLTTGEVVAFLPGPSGTHQILNRAAEPARVLSVATNDLSRGRRTARESANGHPHQRRPAAAAARRADDRGTRLAR